MTARLVLRISAIYLGLLGVASAVLPQTAASGLGQAMTPFDIFAARTVGTTLIALAIADWATSTRPPAGMLVANIVLNATLAVVDTVAIIDHTISASGWTGVTAHIVLLIAFAVAIRLQHLPDRPAVPDPAPRN